jgi:ABC-type uncharacterized transport system permease subunit
VNGGHDRGRGWIAVGLVIFARWSPWRALATALLFGGIEAPIPQLAASGVRLPHYFLLMTPHVVTLAVMTRVALAKRGGVSGPGALGEPRARGAAVRIRMCGRRRELSAGVDVCLDPA